MFSRKRLPEYAAASLCMVAALASIVAITWPWALHFRGEFLSHWDPPFHAWKLEYMARRMLAGDIFLSGGNTNMLYPHSGALYFEALQWPMALFAAPLFALTALPSEVIYHITLLFFWALSAPCMYILLRQLECRRAPASAGAIVFCILPWRISYMVEFQMEMVFAMPLFFGFIIRFFKTMRVSDAVLAVFSWWLLAVSELYEAVFAAMAAVFMVLAFAVRIPSFFKSRRLWQGVCAAALTGGALVCVLLLPYATLHSAGQVMRPMNEVLRHCSQPFSFLVPFGRNFFWTINARHDELSLYPTIAVLAIFLVGGLWHFTRSASNWRKAPVSFLFAAIALLSCVAFYGLSALVQFRSIALSGKVAPLLKYSSLAFLFAPLAYALVRERGETQRVVSLKSLFAVSVFFLILSFGPKVAFGDDSHPIAAFYNTIYLHCYLKYMPFLSGFRVVSRFNVMVLFFLVCASAVTIDAAMRRLNGLLKGVWPNLASCAVAMAFVALVAAEAIPPATKLANYRKVEDQRKSPAIAALIKRQPCVTIAALPCGPREDEGMRMLSMLKGDLPYVYVWGGFFPEYSEKLRCLMMLLDSEGSHRELSRFFPPCVVIVDRSSRIRAKGPFPESFSDDRDPKIVDFDKFCASFADKIDSDSRFSIYALRQPPPMPRASKIFRSDVATSNPELSCSIMTRPGVKIRFHLNGAALGSATADDNGVARFSCRIQKRNLMESPFNDFYAEAEDTTALAFTSFSLSSGNGSYVDVFKR